MMEELNYLPEVKGTERTFFVGAVGIQGRA